MNFELVPSRQAFTQQKRLDRRFCGVIRVVNVLGFICSYVASFKLVALGPQERDKQLVEAALRSFRVRQLHVQRAFL